jgi:hypothetical protein
MSEATSNTEQRERLERELGDQLVTLGEAPPSEAELVLLRGLADDSDPDTNPTSSTNPDIASVARLAELAEPIAFEDLSELELHRAWRGVEQRLPGARASARIKIKPWLFAAVGVAAAAAVLLIVVQSGRHSEDSRQAQTLSDKQLAELAALGDQARTALRLLDDGQSDTERAANLADTYKLRLTQQPIRKEEQGG